MKRKIFIILLLSLLLLTGCSSQVSFDGGDIIAWSGMSTYSDSGAFYSRTSTIRGGDVMCRYSTDTGLAVPLCNKPECTHNINTSPDCNALAHKPLGLYTANGKLYFTESDDNGCFNLMCADINGGSRKKLASIENGTLTEALIDRMRYQDGRLIYTVLVTFDMELMESANEVKYLDRPIAAVRSIDTASGTVEYLVKRQDYNAHIGNAVIDGDTLIYLYSYFTAPPSNENGYTDEEFYSTYRYGVYTVDLKTGEEKCLTDGYDRMTLADQCFDYFSYDRLIFYSDDTNELFRYNAEDGTFTHFARCANINIWYMSDDKSALFLENEEDSFFKRYDFDSGEITELPREGFAPVYLNGTITGEKAWLGYYDENGDYCTGYISRDDLMNGKYDDLKIAYYVNEGA